MGKQDPQEEQDRDESPEVKGGKDGEGEPGPKKPGSKGQGRKRTKTGCLTCRKRRIKCGEERPTCHNCQKSKRQCEGYNQRVVFKDPLNTYRGPPTSASSSQVPFSDPLSSAHRDSFQLPLSSQAPLPIAPKPSRSFALSVLTSDAGPISGLPVVTTPGTERRVYGFNVGANFPTGTSKQLPLQPTSANVDNVDRPSLPEPSKRSPQDKLAHYDFNVLGSVKQEIREGPAITPARISPLEWPSPNMLNDIFPGSSNWHPASSSSVSAQTPFTPHTPNVTSKYTQPGTLPLELEGESQAYDGHTRHGEGRQVHMHPLAGSWIPGMLESAHCRPNDEDGNSLDVSDDENDVNMEDYDENADWQVLNPDHLRKNDLGILVALQAGQVNQDLSLRSITSFIDRPDMLATYVPSPQSSPLRDSMTARIFCHFINVTGPTMSMFERHPANPSLIFQGHPVPRSQQHIWTYTFPTLAFQNPGLLHAMLALASLHIAKLQNEPITASLKHYAISLRRVAKSVSLPNRRGQPATLAAAMLLAFYECWSADHQKWSNHVLGARMLVREIDFAGATRHIKSMKLQQRQQEHDRMFQTHQRGLGGFEDDRSRYLMLSEDVDENIVGMLMGNKVQYDQYGQILDDSIPENNGSKAYTLRELETYENQRDLFWWYCKFDVYQSILGGGPLFMEYDRWSNCPPRAPLGRLNATYGTFDHLILLMGRLANFVSKDLKRKRLAMRANGGWRPPEAMRMQMPIGNQGPAPQMPTFSGMVPDVGEAKLPMGFEPSRDQSPQSSQSEDMDLEARRIEAEEEWQEIVNAFSILEDHFGEDFQALGPEFSAPIQTPFGTALQYRTYGIAGIWMNYYMALIACHRSHPSMPPAAMMAAGISARQTAFFANELGRIAAGIAPDCSMTSQVSPGVGAALIESSTCLFVAGVQYQNASQRAWTVNRLRDIARLTGWQTALAICTGCETAWVKVAELGRGPPYIRTTEERVIPDIWTSSRRIDRAFRGLSIDERRILVGGPDRVHYALGLLGVEEDFEDLDLDGNEK